MSQVNAHDDTLQSSRCRAKRLGLLSLAVTCTVLAIFILAFDLGLTAQTQQTAVQHEHGETVADVLLVMSYDESEANTPLARDGVLDVMSSSAVNVDVVYMDAYHAPLNSAAHAVWVDETSRELAQHGQYNAVICCGDEALCFVERNHETMFASTPVVFFGVNDIAHAETASTSVYTTGMIEQTYMGSIMEVAYRLHPTATSFTAIVDQTPAGIGNRAQFDFELRNYDDMSVRYVNASNLTRGELAAEIASLGADTILFLLDANTDRTGNVYTLEESVAWVTNASNVPVYRTASGGVGSGIAGSTFLDPVKDGKKAAEMTIEVLNGASPSEISLVVEGTPGYVFDQQVLNENGISIADVPAGSTVVNRQVFSLDTLRIIVLPVLLLVLAGVFYRKAHKLAVQAAPAAVQAGAGAVTVPEEPVESPVMEASASAELSVAETETESKEPVRQIDPAAKLTRRQQQARGHKRRGRKDGHQRRLRHTHPVVVSAPAEETALAKVEEERDHLLPVGEGSQENQQPTLDRESQVVMEESLPCPADEISFESQDAQGSEFCGLAESDVSTLVGIEILGLGETETLYGAQAGAGIRRAMQKRLEGVENSHLFQSSDSRILLGFDAELLRGSQELELIELLLRQPVTIEGNSITLNSCIGVVNRQPDMDFEEMKASVDFAVGQAEECGRTNTIVFYDQNVRRAIQDRDKITALLESAIEREDFLVFYQPQVGLREKEVVGYEALVRLKNEEYPPSQFIPVAEVTGQIIELDRIVTKRSVKQLAIWKRRNKRMRPISINFSSVHLTREDDYATFLLDLLKEHDVPSEYIKLEVKETLFNNGNHEKTELFLKQLFDAGVSISLDNFGVGYATFTDVMAIPASIIKIDKGFVDTFLVDGNDQNFEQLVRLAHGLGRKVVVVGVDKEWQIDACRKLNCDIVQGYYFSKPLLPENAVRYKPTS